ncbi:unannotated protein [freshwater metagenome]|uniref:Unannotated protein n=1 Tax=freshwater metagenome TaxID=449393 RepID=A0A6J7EVA7_9ZZZZ
MLWRQVLGNDERGRLGVAGGGNKTLESIESAGGGSDANGVVGRIHAGLGRHGLTPSASIDHMRWGLLPGLHACTGPCQGNPARTTMAGRRGAPTLRCLDADVASAMFRWRTGSGAARPRSDKIQPRIMCRRQSRAGDNNVREGSGHAGVLHSMRSRSGRSNEVLRRVWRACARRRRCRDGLRRRRRPARGPRGPPIHGAFAGDQPDRSLDPRSDPRCTDQAFGGPEPCMPRVPAPHPRAGRVRCRSPGRCRQGGLPGKDPRGTVARRDLPRAQERLAQCPCHGGHGRAADHRRAPPRARCRPVACAWPPGVRLRRGGPGALDGHGGRASGVNTQRQCRRGHLAPRFDFCLRSARPWIAARTTGHHGEPGLRAVTHRLVACRLRSPLRLGLGR